MNLAFTRMLRSLQTREHQMAQAGAGQGLYRSLAQDNLALRLTWWKVQTLKSLLF